MHRPLPFGRFAAGADLSTEDAAAVELLARDLTNFKQASNLDSLRMRRILPSGRLAAAFNTGGIFKVVIYEPHEAPDFRFDGFATTHIPMLFSAAVVNAQVLEGEGVTIRLTEQTRQRLVAYDPEAAPPPKTMALQRFRIEYGDQFKYFEPDDPGIYTFTQYVKHRPTWYSGTMAAVVQVAAGYGIQTMAELPDDPVERARMVIPERWMREIRRELQGWRLPGYKGLPAADGKLVYDYRAGLCHGVGFDDDDKPWLLRVSERGVYAMPLPLVPATTTEAFRSYMEEVGDQEVLALLNKFGGLPSGEAFPDDEQAFEAWRRAGAIIKVCDCADFYSFSSMYAACGWSFNSRASEGFNTCWTREESGLIVVHGYKMRLALRAAEHDGRQPKSWVFEDSVERDRFNVYMAGLHQAMGVDQRSLAIKYKLRRVPVAQILARTSTNFAAEVDYWDNLEMEPIAPHGGNVARVSTGLVYRPGKVESAEGRLKFPEYRGKGCESFVMISPDYEGPSVRCDTVMFGCYVNDRLEVIKYFWDERQFQQETQSTFEEMMIVGSWQETVTTGLTGLASNFYTSSFDDRQETPPRVTTTTITGTDMGYGEPAWGTPAVLYRVGGLSRARYYKHKTVVKQSEGFSLNAAVCVPVFARDAILYAYQDHTSGKSEQMSTAQLGMADPTSYQIWTNDDIFHWIGVTDSGCKGTPYPREGEYAYLDTMVYNPTEYSDYADSGNWFNFPVGSFLDVSSVVVPYTSRYGAHNAGGVVIGGRAPGFQPESSSQTFPDEQSGRVHLVASGEQDAVRVHTDLPNGYYFDFSPAVPDYYFYRDLSRVAIGGSQYLSVSETDAYGLRRRWGYTALVDNKTAAYFMGVINE